MAECPECAANVDLGENPETGEVIECKDCGVELEVKSIDPVELGLAPEVEEDWGE